MSIFKENFDIGIFFGRSPRNSLLTYLMRTVYWKYQLMITSIMCVMAIRPIHISQYIFRDFVRCCCSPRPRVHQC